MYIYLYMYIYIYIYWAADRNLDPVLVWFCFHVFSVAKKEKKMRAQHQHLEFSRI